MSKNIFRTKKELIEFFQYNISNTYKLLLEEKKLHFEGNLLKTYLVEQDLPKDYDTEWLLSNHLKLKYKSQDIYPTV